jgi:hypothetical protein
MFAPRLRPDGAYEPRSEGRKIRVYKGMDTRMMFNDFFAKLRLRTLTAGALGPQGSLGPQA